METVRNNTFLVTHFDIWLLFLSILSQFTWNRSWHKVQCLFCQLIYEIICKKKKTIIWQVCEFPLFLKRFFVVGFSRFTNFTITGSTKSTTFELVAFCPQRHWVVLTSLGFAMSTFSHKVLFCYCKPVSYMLSGKTLKRQFPEAETVCGSKDSGDYVDYIVELAFYCIVNTSNVNIQSEGFISAKACEVWNCAEVIVISTKTGAHWRLCVLG